MGLKGPLAGLICTLKVEPTPGVKMTVRNCCQIPIRGNRCPYQSYTKRTSRSAVNICLLSHIAPDLILTTRSNRIPQYALCNSPLHPHIQNAMLPSYHPACSSLS